MYVPGNTSLITSVCAPVDECVRPGSGPFYWGVSGNAFRSRDFDNKWEITVQKSGKDLFGISLIRRSPGEIAFVILQAWTRALVSKCTDDVHVRGQVKARRRAFVFPTIFFLFTKGNRVKPRHPPTHKSTSLPVLFLQSLFSSLNLCYGV